jgi:hypothetical protein
MKMTIGTTGKQVYKGGTWPKIGKDPKRNVPKGIIAALRYISLLVISDFQVLVDFLCISFLAILLCRREKYTGINPEPAKENSFLHYRLNGTATTLHQK